MSYNPVIVLLGAYLREKKPLAHVQKKDIYKDVYFSTVYNSEKN